MFSYIGFFLFFLAGFLHGLKRDNCWSCNFFIRWFIPYLGTKSSCNVCKEFVRIFCSPPIVLLPSCQPSADGAPPTVGRSLLLLQHSSLAENQYQPQVLQLLLGHHFVYFIFVPKWQSQVWSQNTGTVWIALSSGMCVHTRTLWHRPSCW